MTRFSVFLFLISASGLLVHTRCIRPASYEGGRLDPLLHSAKPLEPESDVNKIDNSLILSRLFARSPVKTGSGADKGESSKKAHEHERKKNAYLVVSSAASWRAEQSHYRSKQERTAHRAQEQNNRGKEVADEATKVLVGGLKWGQSLKSHHKHQEMLTAKLHESHNVRDHHYMQLLKEHAAENKMAKHIQDLSKKLPVVKQRLDKFMPVKAPSAGLKFRLDKAKEVKAQHEFQLSQKLGVYLPPRRGKGGMDGKGGIVDYRREYTPEDQSSGSRGGQSEGRAGDNKQSGTRRSNTRGKKGHRKTGRRGT